MKREAQLAFTLTRALAVRCVPAKLETPARSDISSNGNKNELTPSNCEKINYLIQDKVGLISGKFEILVFGLNDKTYIGYLLFHGWKVVLCSWWPNF